MRFPAVGLDIIEIVRVERLAKSNSKFLKRVFSNEEIRYCQDKKKKWQHFAVRFAAKEAVWKAIGRTGLRLKDISIRRSATGRPGVVLKGEDAPYLQVSLSHTDQYASAVVLYLKPE